MISLALKPLGTNGLPNGFFRKELLCQGRGDYCREYVIVKLFGKPFEITGYSRGVEKYLMKI